MRPPCEPCSPAVARSGAIRPRGAAGSSPPPPGCNFLRTPTALPHVLREPARAAGPSKPRSASRIRPAVPTVARRPRSGPAPTPHVPRAAHPRPEATPEGSSRSTREVVQGRTASRDPDQSRPRKHRHDTGHRKTHHVRERSRNPVDEQHPRPLCRVRPRLVVAFPRAGVGRDLRCREGAEPHPGHLRADDPGSRARGKGGKSPCTPCARVRRGARASASPPRGPGVSRGSVRPRPRSCPPTGRRTTGEAKPPLLPCREPPCGRTAKETRRGVVFRRLPTGPRGTERPRRREAPGGGVTRRRGSCGPTGPSGMHYMGIPPVTANVPATSLPSGGAP